MHLVEISSNQVANIKRYITRRKIRMEAAYRADTAEVGARRPVGVGVHHAVVSAHDGLEGTLQAGDDRLFNDLLEWFKQWRCPTW